MPTQRTNAPGRPLFMAKTRIPLPPLSFVSRPRLLSAIRHGLTRKVTAVIAPAGFGKTTLLAEIARELGGDAAWLTLEPGDQDVSVFGYYLIAAIAQTIPGFGNTSRAWLDSMPDPAAHLADFAAILVEELDHHVRHRLVLCFDDFHTVSESDTITHLLDLLIGYLPPTVHLLLGTRAGMALTTTRLLVQQQIIGLGADDLRFRVEEVEHWLTAQTGVADVQHAADLVAATEGWIAGLILQASTAVPLTAVLAHTQLYAYFSTEVLERQPPAIQEFLLRASVLTPLTPHACQAVLEQSDAAPILQWIADHQLFLTALSGEPPLTYRFHTLFREFLEARLQATAPTIFTQLHQRAAAYWIDQAEYGRAMLHLTAISAWADATQLASQVGTAEVEAGRLERVAGWLAAFPPNTRRHPILLLLETRLLLAQSQHQAAAAVLAQAGQELAATPDAALNAEALLLRARLAAIHADGQAIIQLAQQALSIPTAPAAIHAQAAHYAAIGYAMSGDVEPAEAAFAQAQAAYLALNDADGQAAVLADWGRAYRLRDDLPRAEALLEQALRSTKQTHNRRLEARVLSNLSAVYQRQGDLAQADAHLIAALEIAHRLHWLRVEAEILLGRAEIVFQLGGPTAALRLYEESAAAARQVAPLTWGLALAGQARCLRHLGRAPEAVRRAQQGFDLAHSEQMRGVEAVCQIELGAATLAWNPADAIPLLQAAEHTLGELDTHQDAARAAVILATALFAINEDTAAQQALDRALGRATAWVDHRDLAVELASVYGFPLLRRAANRDMRYAALLTTVVQIRQAEQESAPRPGLTQGRLRVVRDHPGVLEVYSLGQVSVYRDGTLVPAADWQSATAKELFFYLMEHPQDLRKEEILAAIWPDQSATRATTTFHTSMKRLRNALGTDAVQMSDGLYRLNPQVSAWYDAAEAGRLITLARQATDRTQAQRWWAAAAHLLQGPFAPEFYRDWAGARRQFWETQTKEAVSWLADDAQQRQATADAIVWGRRLIVLDPLDEPGHILLMRLYASAGQPALVRQQYAEFCRILGAELGGTPSPQFRQIYEQFLQMATVSA